MQSLNGYWEGSIKIPNQPLLISMELGTKGSTLNIPIQGLNNHPVSRVEIDESDKSTFFELNIDGIILTFEGQLSDNNRITGTFYQQGQHFPFELTKDEEAIKGDWIDLEVDGGVMRGKVEYPKGDAPFPVAIIISGSGPTDKDGNSKVIPGKNNSLKMVAEELSAAGIASIRYDKRGVGVNQGLSEEEEELRFDDYIKDALSWIQYVQNDEGFSNVYVIGHSEGSLIGMIASNREHVDAFVSLAGLGRPASMLIRDQLKTQLPDNLLKEAESILDSLERGETVDHYSPDLHNLFRHSVQPYLASWMVYDPKQELMKVDSKILIINGTKDLQVSVSDAEILHKANSNSKMFIIDGMNHILKEAPEDAEANLATYNNPDLPLMKTLMECIKDFLK